MSFQELKLREPGVMPAVQTVGFQTTVGVVAVSAMHLDANGDILLGTCTTVVADGAVGFAKGATLIDNDAATLDPSGGVFTNVGTRTSAKFRPTGGGIYQTSVTVTAAQLLALNTTPVQVIMAQGTDKVVSLVDVTYTYLFGTTAFTINGSTALALKYTNASGTTLTAVLQPTGFLDQNFTKVQLVPKSTANSVVGVTNAAVVLTVNSASPTVGDGTLRVDVAYRVISTS